MHKYLDIESVSGLSRAEARERFASDGPNELPSARRRGVLRAAFDVFREPMFLLLVACGAIYFVLGDRREAFMLLGFVIVIMGITLYQEQKTEHALEALKDLSSPRALVIRDGQQTRIAGREVVKGDMILLFEGDRVPADAALVSCINLSIDESLLTGESAPVKKFPCEGDYRIGRPGGDGLTFVYSGTLVVQGQGIARVEETGARTELGKIGKALSSIETEQTFVQKETKKLVGTIAVVGTALCALVVVLYGFSRHDWLHGFLAGITLAMATLPEEFPVVLTVFFALGAWRISKNNVLTRRVPAIETLGSTTVLCVDKTGTLTLNKMSVSYVFSNGRYYTLLGHKPGDFPEVFHQTVEFAMLASQKDPFDPMERAIKELGNSKLCDTEHIHDNWALITEYPLDARLLAMSRVWKSPDGRDYIIASKGAPEAVLDLCHIEGARAAELLEHVKTLAARGLRVLGVAKASFTATDLPGGQHDFVFEFLGFLGLEDPVRPGVKEAIAECRKAGIRVIMITGDHPVTAQNIARSIGLRSYDDIITGGELEKMSGAELRERLKHSNIFARAVPEQKLKIIRALKENGEIVAMTGDGVNDAPALKAADIGIAMGNRGTDVAREASALVLVDDDFTSIVRAVKMGRRIFENLKKAMSYIFAVHVPIAGMSLLPVLFKWPLALLPVHIVFLELIIDPACSVVFEAEPAEPGLMERPPRKRGAPLFGKKTVFYSLVQGFGVLAIVCAVFIAALNGGGGELEARTMAFATLIFANLGLILTNRSWSSTIISTLRSKNTALWAVLSGAVIFLGLVLYLPPLRELFHFEVLHFADLVICACGGAVSIAWFEILKVVNKKRNVSIA